MLINIRNADEIIKLRQTIIIKLTKMNLRKNKKKIIYKNW